MIESVEPNQPGTAGTPPPPEPKERPLRWYHIVLLMLATVAIATALAVWIIKVYVFPAEFKPVELSTREEKVLNAKLDRLDTMTAGEVSRQGEPAGQEPLEPEAYNEVGARREINFTEREVNALLAKNTDLARKLAIDLSDDLVSAKLILPVDEDFPILGGKTLKVKAGVELAYGEGRPIVVLRGISIMGVPLPNAWLGGLKHIDLVREYGAQEGFWKAFADGVEDIRVQEGKVRIQLKE